MRIAIVCDYYLDYVGGAQSSILEQARALEEEGHVVVLISSVRSSRLRLVPRRNAIEVRPSWTVPGLVLPVVGSRPKLVTLLRRHLAELEVDVVHVQTEFGLAHAAVDAARELGVPIVHTVHTFYWQAAGLWQAPLAPVVRLLLEKLIGRRLNRRRIAPPAIDNVLRNLTLTMAHRADVVVSPSAHQATDLRSAGLRVPIVVIPNPVGVHHPTHPVTIDPPRIAWVARCEPEKRPLVFVEAVLIAQRRSSVPFEVDFIGGGSQLAGVRRAFGDAPRVRVRGTLDRGDVLTAMDSSSVVAITSHAFDNQPMTIAEAVSPARGVLYCDPRLEEGLSSAGYLAASPDAEGIAAAIVAIVESPQLVARLSEGAAAAADLFAAASFVHRVITTYESVTTRPAVGVGISADIYTR